jgi:hypothetical protein
MEQGDGHRPQTYRTTFTSPPILRRVAPPYAERQRALPRLGDIWIPKSAVSPNHFVRLYIPGGGFISGGRSLASGGARWIEISPH